MPRDTITIRRRGGYFLAPVTEATVLFDSSGITGGASTSPTTWAASTPITVGGGVNGTTNRVLIAIIFFVATNAGVATPTSLIWDSAGGGGAAQPMTQIAGAHIGSGNISDTWIYGLINPNLGARMFQLTWTGTSGVNLVAASFVNADQTGGATTFINLGNNSGSGTVATMPISVVPTTRKIVTGFLSPVGSFTPGAASGTNIGNDNGGNVDSLAASWDAGTVSSTTYTMAPTGIWAALAVALKGA